MKHRALSVFSVFFFLLSSVLALASDEPVVPRIQQGDWELGGGFNLNRMENAWSRGSRSVFFHASGAAQYFAADGLSIGLEAAFSRYGRGQAHGKVGPVVTKYFLATDRLAPYVSMLPIQWTKSESFPSSLSSTARVGFKYFFTDAVAVGPALEYEYDWATNGGDSWGSFSLLGMFSIHL